ncbi:MAG: formate/nitrite transporter family protein [Burkholderiales bacterium]
MPELFGFDAYSPAQIAERVETVGVAKARSPMVSLVLLGMLAGAFIGFGALFSVLAASDTSLGFAPQRLLMGLTFSLGLVLVVVAGAELFTGNNLLVMAWADRRISTSELLRNWLVVYISNAVGAMGLALFVYLSHHADLSGGGIGAQYVKIAAAKTVMPFAEAFFKGVLCNALVCLAVWLTLAGHTVADKILAVVFPISAFVAAGFEHSVANMYFIPLGILLHGAGYGASDASVTWLGFLQNLLPVTIGNIFGGSVMVALVYYLIYRRNN